MTRWRRFWLSHGGCNRSGRVATWLGTIGGGSYRALHALASVVPSKGYIAPSAEIIEVELRLGLNVFVGERVVIARWAGKGFVELGDRVEINRETYLELFDGGYVTIGAGAAIQPRCQFTAAVQPIHIGPRVQIASYCAFYPYDHGIAPGMAIVDQPLVSKGPIVVEEGAWLGLGVIVLSGVKIGQGAVVAAGSVVTQDIPAGAIAVGTPARVVKYRDQMQPALGGGG